MYDIMSILYAIVNTIGITSAALLAFLIIKRTPRGMRNYSVLILNSAVCDFFACTFSAFTQQRCHSCSCPPASTLHDIFFPFRLINTNVGALWISDGPCRLIGSRACFTGFAIMLHCYPYGLYILLLSFCYRYYILSNPIPTPRSIVTVASVIYVPSAVQLVSLS
ncbi:hypothetical protein OESDEN_08713 [Oesophagostomum dentatum]|uniref:G-protein coupled receptors family 1 profile domain-containing protein n=1 Tax=Oesophagostomum dentatum TaxID=61180 RepID=A0A0B1T2E7_OESDE|nr:hypothetical protein OESDEN_08713 [Oesophagostomum dentatum]